MFPDSVRMTGPGFGSWVPGFESWVSGFGFRVSGFEFQVSGTGLRVWGEGSGEWSLLSPVVVDAHHIVPHHCPGSMFRV